LTLALGIAAHAQEKAAPASTLDNLQAAYNGESNANAKYLAYAKKADEEGYGKVASLWRAAARAEQVHLERHAKIISDMGGIPKADVKLPEIRSTKENLQDSFKGETYESTEMYPVFLKQAEAEKNAAAIDSFEDAEKAEAVHAKLYDEAFKNVDAWKGANQEFYVCPLCGNVEQKLPDGSCPICGTAVNLFIPVS